MDANNGGQITAIMKPLVKFYQALEVVGHTGQSAIKQKKWRWNVTAANGQILADSGEGYTRKIDAVRAASAVGKVLQTI